MSDTAELITRLEADGLRLSLADRDTLEVEGDRDRLAHWVPILREHKPDILRVLARPRVLPGDAHTTPRPRVTRYEVTVEGYRPFILIDTHGRGLAEQRRILSAKFGDRFQQVEPLRGRP